MKHRTALCALLLATIALLSCLTSCNSFTDTSGGPAPLNPNQAAKQVTFDFKKDDVLDPDNRDKDVTYVPEAMTFQVSVNNASGFGIERLYGTLTVCDADGQFICAISTPAEGWTDVGGVAYKTFSMTTKDLSSMAVNQLFCAHGSQLQVTFEITNITFRQYDNYGDYEAMQASELPPKANVKYIGYDMNDWIGRNEDEFRVAAKIFKNGGYEQSLTIFEELLQEANEYAGYGWAGDIMRFCQPYADKCHEILDK